MRRHIGAERRQSALKAAAVVAILREVQTTLAKAKNPRKNTKVNSVQNSQDNKIRKSNLQKRKTRV